MDDLPWVSVDERLPRMGVNVLVCYKVKRTYGTGSFRYYDIGKRDKDYGWRDREYNGLTDITHWCPLNWPRKVAP